MFEGTNKIVLCQEAVMKIVEQHINSMVGHREELEVTNLTYNPMDWTITFDIKKRYDGFIPDR